MTHILVVGNSASGKSTLAQHLAHTHGLAHLDLDPLAWYPGTPPRRLPVAQSLAQVQAFIDEHSKWVIEGCYADILWPLLPQANELVFLDLAVDTCIANAQARPWEAHKYASKAEQDANLSMLIDWIASYDSRTDTCSRAAHVALFKGFSGNKVRHTTPVSLAESKCHNAD